MTRLRAFLPVFAQTLASTSVQNPASNVLPGAFLATIPGVTTGSYKLSNGTGGSDGGAFSVPFNGAPAAGSCTIPPSVLTWMPNVTSGTNGNLRVTVNANPQAVGIPGVDLGVVLTNAASTSLPVSFQ